MYFEHKMLNVCFQYRHAWIPASTYLLGTVRRFTVQTKSVTKGVYIHPHCFSYTMEQPSEIGEIAAFRHRVCSLPGMWSPADSRTNAGQRHKLPCIGAGCDDSVVAYVVGHAVVGHVTRLLAEDCDTSDGESCR